jgi:hypothetical protein
MAEQSPDSGMIKYAVIGVGAVALGAGVLYFINKRKASSNKNPSGQVRAGLEDINHSSEPGRQLFPPGQGPRGGPPPRGPPPPGSTGGGMIGDISQRPQQAIRGKESVGGTIARGAGIFFGNIFKK